MNNFDNSALIVVDVQNDFCEGGSLEVRDASKIIPKINKIRQQFKNIIFTQDWHPENHVSFKENHKNLKNLSPEQLNNLWPVHCIQNTKGSELHRDLKLSENDICVHKGEDENIDSYSGFGNGEYKTLLHSILQNLSVKTLFICGLALDYCVLFTAIDALKLGYKVRILKDCSQAIDPTNVKAKVNILLKTLDFETDNFALINSEDL